MKFPKILKDKRGIALENAILFMIIIFALCTLLTNLTLLGHYQLKIEKVTLDRAIMLDQIGEDYVDSRITKAGFTLASHAKYTCRTFEGAHTDTLRVYPKSNPDNVVLFIEVDKDGNVLQWRYSEP